MTVSDPRVIRTKEDAQAIESDLEALVEGWYPAGTRIDWDDLLYRLEGWGYTLSDADDCMVNDPAIKQIKRMVREMRKAG